MTLFAPFITMSGSHRIRRTDMRKLLLVLTPVLSFALLAQTSAAKRATPKPADAIVVPGLPPGVATAMNSIDAERIRAHDKFLADDLLEGRGTGQRGGDLAARYMAAQFELYGLKPAGDNGTYLKKVQFVGVATEPQATHFALVPDHGIPMPLKFADDYVTTNETQTATADIDAPIVFVG